MNKSRAHSPYPLGVVVPSNAFSASFEEVTLTPSGVERVSGRRHHSGTQQVRDDLVFTRADGPVHRASFLTDLNTRKSVIIDTASGAVLRQDFGREALRRIPERLAAAGSPPPAAVPLSPQALTTPIGLGKKEISGLPCEGTLTELADGRTIEMWKSTLVPGQRVSHTVRRGDAMEYTFEMKNFDHESARSGPIQRAPLTSSPSCMESAVVAGLVADRADLTLRGLAPLS